jgi:type IV secretory pathway TrbF-like protein
MSTSTNGATTAVLTPGPAIDTVETAQRADYSENSRKRIEAVSWRRAFAGVSIIAILLAISNIVQASKYHTDVLVFRETAQGISFSGQAAQELTPSNNAIASALGQFVACRRGVPGDDAQVDQCVNMLEVMTADIAPYHAHSDLLSDLSKDENNPKFERKSFTRSVRRLDTDEIHTPGTNTWQIQWIEDLTKDGKTTASLHNGEITIAPNPHLPTDQQSVNADPAGVVVVQYDLH